MLVAFMLMLKYEGFFVLIMQSEAHVSASQWDRLLPQQRSPAHVRLYWFNHIREITYWKSFVLFDYLGCLILQEPKSFKFVDKHGNELLKIGDFRLKRGYFYPRMNYIIYAINVNILLSFEWNHERKNE